MGLSLFEPQPQQTMDQAIKDYVGQVLSNNSWSDAQKAQAIKDQAARVGVSNEQIASATGFSLDNVNSYLNLAPSPSPTRQQIDAAEQAARQAWLDNRPVPQEAINTLFRIEPGGQVTRVSDGYSGPDTLNSVSDPAINQYLQKNPEEFFGFSVLKSGPFENASVKNTDKTMGQFSVEQLARGYLTNYATGWDTSVSSPGLLGTVGSGSSNSVSGLSWQPSGASSPGSSNYSQTGLVVGGGSPAGGSVSGQVTPDMTIQGRLNALLGTDQYGNYTNPVVRQAAERAMQAFAGRGLLNSSMAVQAAQEAAIAKAIEIVGPDAQRFFEQGRANQEWANKFNQDALNNAAELEKARILAQLDLEKLRTEYGLREDASDVANAFNLRQNYMNQLANIQSNYQQMVNNINQSGMRPEDKEAAIRDAASTRDAELAYTNDMYSRMPGWSQQWLAPAVPLQGVDINSITNLSTLNNIISDPAQPQSVRDQAWARRQQLLSAQPASTTTGNTQSSGLLSRLLSTVDF